MYVSMRIGEKVEFRAIPDSYANMRPNVIIIKRRRNRQIRIYRRI